MEAGYILKEAPTIRHTEDRQTFTLTFPPPDNLG